AAGARNVLIGDPGGAVGRCRWPFVASRKRDGSREHPVTFVVVTDPLVSILMAAWKPRPEWLRQAVASALEQQGCRIELVVVDDGSPDPVADLLHGIADNRMHLVRTTHGGVAHAR